MSRFLPGRAGVGTLIGMVHLGPVLDGATRLADVVARAIADAEALAEAGFDAICAENFGDAPFYPGRVPAHTVAGMTRALLAVRAVTERAGIPLGVNVLRNDCDTALAIAAAVDAAFVRVNVHTGAMVTDQGLIEGRAHETVRWRDRMAPDVAIYADVQVKHAAPLAPRPLDEEAREVFGRGRADALIVSGARTGGKTDVARLEAVRAAVPEAPILVGSGATPDDVKALLRVADGVIVGSWLKEGGQVLRPVDPARARAFVAAARG
ncbi:MAG: BtpA/SgcQ family protein [Deltaproteobacteria bacterium]|nr:BtpA/SgcQ family protein [Deltaproteobacteria bacterium]